MTQADYTHYLMITDVSGSMITVRGDAEGGVRQFLKDMAALPGKSTLSFYQFDSACELVHDFTALEAAFGYALTPRGMTTIFDACGRAVTEVGARLAAMPENQRPAKVVVMITTDGDETVASREWTPDAIKTLFTTQQEKYGWAFSFAGANIDAFAAAARLGIPQASTMQYVADSAGAQQAYASMSRSIGAYASGQSIGINYADDDADPK